MDKNIIYLIRRALILNKIEDWRKMSRSTLKYRYYNTTQGRSEQDENYLCKCIVGITSSLLRHLPSALGRYRKRPCHPHTWRKVYSLLFDRGSPHDRLHEFVLPRTRYYCWTVFHDALHSLKSIVVIIMFLCLRCRHHPFPNMWHIFYISGCL